MLPPSKHIVDSFLSLNLSELRRFRKIVLIPQNAKNLLESANEAERILMEREESEKGILSTASK